MQSYTLYVDTFNSMVRFMIADPRWHPLVDEYLCQNTMNCYEGYVKMFTGSSCKNNADFWLAYLSFYRSMCTMISNSQLRDSVYAVISSLECLIRASQQRCAARRANAFPLGPHGNACCMVRQDLPRIQQCHPAVGSVTTVPLTRPCQQPYTINLSFNI